jgi:hypothetical protein
MHDWFLWSLLALICSSVLLGLRTPPGPLGLRTLNTDTITCVPTVFCLKILNKFYIAANNSNQLLSLLTIAIVPLTDNFLLVSLSHAPAETSAQAKEAFNLN